MSEITQKTCKDRVESHLESRLDDLRQLWAAYNQEDCLECDNGEIESDCESCNGSSQVDSIQHFAQMIVKKDCVQCGGLGLVYNTCEFCEGEGQQGDSDGYHSELGHICEYGLGFDYVAPHTFGEDQDEGYFRFQISWGGPSEEFRIYANGREYDWSIYKLEFWFLDWFDGAKITLTGIDKEFMLDLMHSLFVEIGSFESAYNESMP